MIKLFKTIKIEIVDEVGYLDEVKKLIIKFVRTLNRNLSFQNLDYELTNLKIKDAGNNGKMLGALVEKIIDLTKVDGYQEIVLDTIKPLKSVISLNQKFGFTY